MVLKYDDVDTTGRGYGMRGFCFHDCRWMFNNVGYKSHNQINESIHICYNSNDNSKPITDTNQEGDNTLFQYPSGLIANYVMGDYRNTAIDLFNQLNKDHAVLRGFSLDSYQSDGSLKLDGVNTVITTPFNQTIFNGSNGAGYESIVKYGDLIHFDGLFGDHFSDLDGVGLRAEDQSNLCLVVSGGLVRFNIDNNKYVHLVITYDRVVNRAYINGVLVGSTNNPNRTISSRPILIGRSMNISGCYMNGNIKEFNIYNRALTPQEITANFNYFKLKGDV